MKHLKKFNESLYDEQSSDIYDDLKSNFRSWEQDHEACDWTGHQE